MMDQVIRRMPGVDPAYGGTRVLRCAFTGHRPHKLFCRGGENSALCEDFKKRLADAIRMLVWEGYSHFIAGGAQGMDTYAAEIVLALRREYPWIGLEIAVPYEAQEAMWAPADRLRYAHILAQADIVTYVGRAYSREAIEARNRYLVDNADMVLAAYNGRAGGTAMTINYAKRIGVPVTCIAPAGVRTQHTA